MWFSAIVIAVAGLAAWGCGGAPIAPSSPTAQEPQKPEEQEQAWNPFVAVEPGGRVFMTYYGGRGGSEYRLLFNRSLDGGVTWLGQPIQLDTPPPARSRIGFHRLETNGGGRVSVTWSYERKEEQYWRTRELRNRQSPDSGTSWTGEVLGRPFFQQSNYPTPLTDRDGTLYLLYTEGPASSAIPRFARSKGPGLDWASEPLTLPRSEGATGNPQDKGDPLNRREATWPVLASDSRHTLYAVWQETSAQGTDILFNRSRDGGSTWLDSSLRLNTPPPGPTHTSRIPVVAVNEPGRIFVVWEDFRHNTTDLYFNRSLDGGTTWLAQDVWVTAVRPPLASASGPVLSADRSGHLYIIWTDLREAPNSLYFTRSLDEGATWSPNAIRIDRHGPKEIAYAPRLARDDAGHVYAAWWEGEDATKGSVHFSWSDDYATTWHKNEQPLDTFQRKGEPQFPWLSADGKGGVYVVWRSARSGRYQLYLNR